jgi:DNA-binding NarL/FixJ family response regulator
MSDDKRRIRILAVDDHPLLRQGIASLIAADQPAQAVEDFSG